MPINLPTRAWLFVVPLIPSIAVSIFDIYHFLGSRTLRKALNNHVVIVLLVCGLIEQLIDIVLQAHFYRTSYTASNNRSFCLMWVIMGPSMYISIFVLMAWASIERHVLIFYPRLFATKLNRLLFHYLPLAICILWPFMFYFVIFVFLPCTITPASTARYCFLYGCLTSKMWASYMDSIANYIMPSFVTVLFSMGLFVRVIYHRYRIRGRIDWRNYKKMAGQLLPISVLCIAFQFPPIIFYAAYTGGLSRSVGSAYYSDGLFFTYWIVLFNPFACALSLPDLKTKVRNVIFFWRRQNAVQPAMAMTRRNADQTVVPARKPGPGAPPPISVPAPEPVVGQVANVEGVTSGATVAIVSNQMPQVDV